jgi:uncharacterized protein YbjQ (UPF0145 family)
MMSSRITVLCFALLAVLLSADASARTTIHHLPAADVLNETGFASQIAGVKFYFGNSPYPTVVQEFGEYRTNKKTNAFNKTDIEACKWVFKSAILSLHKRAVSLGANAVINIRSNFKNRVETSDTDYTCGAGGVMAGVALIGDFVKVE